MKTSSFFYSSRANCSDEVTLWESNPRVTLQMVQLPREDERQFRYFEVNLTQPNGESKLIRTKKSAIAINNPPILVSYVLTVTPVFRISGFLQRAATVEYSFNTGLLGRRFPDAGHWMFT